MTEREKRGERENILINISREFRITLTAAAVADVAADVAGVMLLLGPMKSSPSSLRQK